MLVTSAVREASDKEFGRALVGGKDSFVVECVMQPAAALASIKQNAVAAVLVGFEPPQSTALDTLRELTNALPDRPISVIGDDLANDTAVKVLEQGAQVYLLKNRLDRYTLVRAVRSAIGRKIAEDNATAALRCRWRTPPPQYAIAKGLTKGR